MTTELTEIDGVGPSYAEDLQEAGYESAEDVADADADELDGLMETASGDDIVANAQDEVSEDDESKDDESPEDPAKEESFELTPGFSDVQEYHLIAALVEQEISARRTNDTGRVEATQDMMAQVRAGEPYNLTLQQLSIAYTGTNQLQSKYRGTRGLSTVVGQAREISQVFQQARQRNWPENEE